MTEQDSLHTLELALTRILDNHLQEFKAGHTHIVYEQVLQLIEHHTAQAVREARMQEQRFLSGAIDRGENITDWNRQRKTELTQERSERD